MIETSESVISGLLGGAFATVRPRARHEWLVSLTADVPEFRMWLVDGWLRFRSLPGVCPWGVLVADQLLRNPTGAGWGIKPAMVGSENLVLSDGCSGHELDSEGGRSAATPTIRRARNTRPSRADWFMARRKTAELALCCEWFLTGADALAAALPWLADSLSAMWVSTRDGTSAELPGASVPVASAESPGGEVLEATCAEVGWTPRLQQDGSVEVALEESVAFRVSLRSLQGGLFEVSAVLASLDCALSDIARRALTVLMLRLNGALRGVRAAWREGDGGQVIALECFGLDARSAEAVSVAVGSLEAGYRMAAAEVHALTDPEISRIYLALTPGGPPKQHKQQKKGTGKV